MASPLWRVAGRRQGAALLAAATGPTRFARGLLCADRDDFGGAASGTGWPAPRGAEAAIALRDGDQAAGATHPPDAARDALGRR